MADSKGRVVLITGVTRGIGHALTMRLAELGHTVIGCGRSKTTINALASALGSPHRFDAVDVSQWTAVEAWAADILSQSPPPDLLVNNAGIINSTASLWQISAEDFGRVLDVNVDGVANVIRAFLPAMIEVGGGVVVNISSGWGRSAAAHVAPYCASKWAIEGLTQALSQELPAGLAAVAVNPGVIDTTMLRSCWADSAAAFPEPEEWAIGAADFLLSLGVKDNGRSLSV